MVYTLALNYPKKGLIEGQSIDYFSTCEGHLHCSGRELYPLLTMLESARLAPVGGLLLQLYTFVSFDQDTSPRCSSL